MRLLFLFVICQMPKSFTVVNKRKTDYKKDESVFCYVFVGKEEKKVIVALRDNVWMFDKDCSLSELLNCFSPPASLMNNDNICYNGRTKLVLALTPNRYLKIGNTYHRISYTVSTRAVENWLIELNLEHLIPLFYQNFIDDFFVIPYITEGELKKMEIDEKDITILLDSVAKLRDCSCILLKWMTLNGIHHYSRLENQNSIKDLKILLPNSIPDIAERIQFREADLQYSQFSSVQATYIWLTENGFEEVAFRFVRFNIPFYALPKVNFFIIHEMGIINHKELLSAFEKLKNSPAYSVRALCFWLRDLNLEFYTPKFLIPKIMNDFMENLHVDKDTILELVSGSDHEKLLAALDDMEAFSKYFAVTAILVDDLLMDKYSDVYSLHNISIDYYPLLTDDKLNEIGITDVNDKKKILKGIEKLKKELPDFCIHGMRVHGGFKPQ